MDIRAYVKGSGYHELPERGELNEHRIVSLRKEGGETVYTVEPCVGPVVREIEVARYIPSWRGERFDFQDIAGKKIRVPCNVKVVGGWHGLHNHWCPVTPLDLNEVYGPVEKEEREYREEGVPFGWVMITHTTLREVQLLCNGNIIAEKIIRDSKIRTVHFVRPKPHQLYLDWFKMYRAKGVPRGYAKRLALAQRPAHIKKVYDDFLAECAAMKEQVATKS
jgi:hypothetical protein